MSRPSDKALQGTGAERWKLWGPMSDGTLGGQWISTCYPAIQDATPCDAGLALGATRHGPNPRDRADLISDRRW